METPQRRPIIIPKVARGETPALPPGTTHFATDLAKLKRTEQDMLAAASTTPAAVSAALTPQAISFGGRPMHTMSIQTYQNLVALKSPFIERKPGEAVSPTIDEIILTLWAMTEDDVVVEDIIFQGAAALRQAKARFAAAIPIEELAGGSAAAGATIEQGFAPAAKMMPPDREGGGSPLPVTSSATAPAGS